MLKSNYLYTYQAMAQVRSAAINERITKANIRRDIYSAFLARQNADRKLRQAVSQIASLRSKEEEERKRFRQARGSEIMALRYKMEVFKPLKLKSNPGICGSGKSKRGVPCWARRSIWGPAG